MAAPAHKQVPGTAFIVDGFRYTHVGQQPCRAYFLTHGHSDHYTGLSDNWAGGPIFCSEITARVVQHLLGVGPTWLLPLPLGQPTLVEGVEVTLVDANHCPGAVQVLFRLPDGRKYIHTGDMRFNPSLLSDPHLSAFRGADGLYLDTTYCNPRYCFPTQEVSIDYVASTMRALMVADSPAAGGGSAGGGSAGASSAAAANSGDGSKEGNAAARGPSELDSEGASELPAAPGCHRRLYLISTYGIGKERILAAIAAACSCRIAVSPRKLATLRCLDLPGLDIGQVFTTDAATTPVRVVQWGFLGDTWPYFRPNWMNAEALREAEGAEEIVGFVPTGWLHEAKKAPGGFPQRSKGACTLHLVPYSEHSSFAELQEYVRWLRPHQVIPTVGVGGEDGEKQRAKMQGYFRGLVDQQASKAKFLAGLHLAAAAQAGAAVPLPSDAPAPGPAAAAGALESEPPTAGDAGAGAGASGGGGGRPRSGSTGGLGGKGGGVGCSSGAGDSSTNGSGSQLPRTGGTGSGGDEEQGKQLQPRRGEEESEEKEDEEEEQQQQQATAPSQQQRSSTAPASGNADEDAALAQLEAVIGPSSTSGAGSTGDGGTGSSAAEIDLTGEGASMHVTPPSSFQEAGIGQQAAEGEGRPHVSREDLRRLLAAAGGSVERALNWWFDGSWRTVLGSGPQRSGAASQQQQPRQLTQQQQQQGSKRRKAGEPAESGGSASKRQKKKGGGGAALDPSQRSILSFFGGPTSAGSPPAACKQQQHPCPDESAPEPAGGAGQPASPAAAAPLPATVAPAQSPRCPAAWHAPPAPTQVAAAASAAARDAVAQPLWQYDPVRHSCWAAGQPTPYLHIARAFEAAEATTKRLRIGDILTNLFRSVLALAPDDLVQTAYLTCGRIAPDYEGQELNVGGATVAAALTEATGVGRPRLREMYNSLGDLGDVAQACKRSQTVLLPPPPLTVRGVFAVFRGLAAERGAGAAARRQRSVLALLRAAREAEPRYLVRTLVQALRVGANWRTVIPALARAVLIHKDYDAVVMASSRVAEADAAHAVGHAAVAGDTGSGRSSARDTGGAGLTGSSAAETSGAATAPAPTPPSKAALDQAGAAATAAFHVCPNLELLTRAMLDHPLAELAQRCTLSPGVPIKPMLAKAGEGPGDTLRQLKGQPFLAEMKYDGMRAQIHLLASGEVRIFSRNCEDKTGAYPDVVAQVRQAAAGGASSCILDAELVAVDRSQGNRLRAFQDLASRAKADVALADVSIHVCVFAFDLLYVDGTSLLDQPLRQRRAALAAALPGLHPGRVALAQGWELSATGELAGSDDSSGGSSQQEQQQGVLVAEDGAAGEEGAGEEASSEAWLRARLVEAFDAGAEGLMLKALDGAYQPSKRSESWVKLKRDYCSDMSDTLDVVPIGAWWGNGRKAGWYSPFLLAVWDPASEELQSICRCMSGFSDSFYREARERLGQAVIPGPRPYYRTAEQPDVWFNAREVWEIRGADLTISPKHQAAVGVIDAAKGLGLRFPRFLRLRDDKGVEDATTAEQVATMYRQQTRKAVGGPSAPASAAGEESGEEEGGTGGPSPQRLEF